jgi:hypothetical protein
MDEDRELYDVRHAARRVHRARWTIYHWMRDGMSYRTIAGRRYIEHDILLATYRGKLTGRTEHARRHDPRGRFVAAQEKVSELV